MIPIKLFLLLIILKSCLTKELDNLESLEIVKSAELSLITEMKEAASNATLRLTTPKGIQTLKMSQNFLDFLKSNESASALKRYGSCLPSCQESLYHIRYLQAEPNYQSLFELHYYLSLSPGCYCLANANYYEEEESIETMFIDILVDFGSPDSRPYDVGYSCQWENVLNWLIRLIRCRIYDLRRFNLADACYECICRN